MSHWKDHATAALLGTGQARIPSLPEALRAVAEGSADIREDARFLTQAGALALWRRAGWQPPRSEAESSACEPETTTSLNPANVGYLRAMLSGRGTAVLPEWLGQAARLGRHLPPEYLPTLLDRARQDRSLRPLVLAAGGRRSHWLTAQNPEWAFGESENWETGNREQRVALLRTKRAAAPSEAQGMIETAWKTEPAETRAAFLAELALQLSDEDAAFLESTLDDRSKEVRRVAVDLLARLPESAFTARMVARASPLLTFQPGGLLSRATLEITLPSDPDAVATRDGLDPKAFGPQKQIGEKAVLLVLLLSAVPLRYWSDKFQQPPATLLKAAEKSEFARTLATGWAWAALRQRDAVWAEALLDSALQPHGEFLPAEPLLALLPEAARADRLTGLIRSGAMNKAGSPEWIDCLAELTVLAERAPATLVREALAALRNSAEAGWPWTFRAPVENLFLRLPPPLLAEAAAAPWPIDQEGVGPLVDLLTFRRDALSALTQS